MYSECVSRKRVSFEDEHFLDLLDDYLDPPSDPNPAMCGVVIDWVTDDERLGALHMKSKHQVSQEEVEEVLLQIPPMVQAKRSPRYPGRTLFWGATRRDRWLFIVCEDWKEGELRHLKPITAFEPDDGQAYWDSRG